mmetsp:Transcript_100070/g.173730  ORF Transcript_100070/g.173730 Transcript_100070/m.173730 type:complete len:424 (+) Transcript_100070:65-1336(+)
MAQSKEEADKMMAVLSPAMLTILAAGTATLQARQMLIAQTAQPMGAEAVTAATKGLATAFSIGSLVEFLISPIFGKMSEKYGRKPIFLSFLLGPAATRALCVLIKPPNLRIPMLWADFAGARFMGLQPTVSVCQTMISDIVPVDQQPKARSQIQAAQSMGQIIGNYASGYINATFGPATTYIITGLIPATSFLVLGGMLSETHPAFKAGAKIEDAPATGTAAPVKVEKKGFGVLLNDPKCCFQALTLGFYEFMTYPPISTVSILFMKERLSWGPLEAGRFSAGHALAVFMGSMISSRLQGIIGKKLYVTLAHCSMSVAYAIWGSATNSTNMLLSLVPMALGSGAKEVLMTSFVKRAADLGMGKGEAGSVVQAMGAAMRMLAPQLFIQLYTRASGKNKSLPPGAPMFLVTFVALLQEVLHRLSS